MSTPILWPGTDAHLTAMIGDGEDLSWMDRGRCAEVDADLFFPQVGDCATKARLVCRGCEVRVLCLEYALETGQAFGVWGSYSERERRRLKRQRDAATA